MKRILTLSLGLMLLLTGCGRPAEFPVPEGVHIVRAVLQPVPFSLKRRGTHALIAPDGKMAAYAESVAVNLHALEGREVELQGRFEKNSDPSELPVLIVEKVLDGGEAPSKPWAIPALGLSLELPRAWKGTIKGKSASFTASGVTLPILVITLRIAAPKTGSNPLYAPLAVASSSATSELLVVGLRKGTAAMSAAGDSWVVAVAPSGSSDGGSETIFTFLMQTDIAVDRQLSAYGDILRSVEFNSSGASTSSSRSAVNRSSSIPSNTSGSSQSRMTGEGMPCGGSAGILCLSGMYCKITDPVSDSGVCTKR